MIKSILYKLEKFGYLPIPMEMKPPMGLSSVLSSALTKMIARDKLSPSEKTTVMNTVEKIIDEFEAHQQERDKASRAKSGVPKNLPLFMLTDEERRQLVNFCVYTFTKFCKKYANGDYHVEDESEH